jgi:PEP-CTERM motif
MLGNASASASLSSPFGDASVSCYTSAGFFGECTSVTPPFSPLSGTFSGVITAPVGSEFSVDALVDFSLDLSTGSLPPEYPPAEASADASASVDISVTPTPEPSSLLLVVFGLAVIGSGSWLVRPRGCELG